MDKDIMGVIKQMAGVARVLIQEEMKKETAKGKMIERGYEIFNAIAVAAEASGELFQLMKQEQDKKVKPHVETPEEKAKPTIDQKV